MDDEQIRNEPGQQVRNRTRADVVDIIRRANLRPDERVQVLEHVGTAFARDLKEDLGGARHLTRAAHDLSTPGRLLAPLATLASRFVHPRQA